MRVRLVDEPARPDRRGLLWCPEPVVVHEALPAVGVQVRDYYSSFGIADPVPVTPEQIHLDKAWSIERSTEGYARPGLESLQEGLVKAFPSL